MMKKEILATLVFTFLSMGISSAQKQDSIRPNEKIEVNREYDEAGNLIRYDSIYSYSSTGGSLSEKKMDSILSHFFSDKDFMPSINSFDFNDFMIPENFFNNFGSMDTVFSKEFELYKKRMDSLLKYYKSKKENTTKSRF